MKSLGKRMFRPLILVAAPRFARNKTGRLASLGAIVLILLVVAVVALKRPSNPSHPAVALADSSVAGDSTKVAEKASPKGKKKGKNEKKEEPPVPVEVAIAGPRDIPATFVATGSLEAKRQVKLIAKSGGQITKLAVEEGDFVKQGAVLLEVEHREEQLKLEQNKVREETAQRELERTQGLMSKELGSAQDLENRKDEAQVATLNLHMSEVELDNKIVRAPFAGQVTVRDVQIGQTVNVGQSLIEVADVSPLQLKLYLPEKMVGQLAAGQSVNLFSDVDPSLRLTGVVERIAPAVDPATSTVKVTLHVDAANGKARVGTFVRAHITTDIHKGAVSVPRKALVPEAGVTYLFIAEADTVRKVPVTTGYSDESYVEIVSGVTSGTKVVSVGQGGLRDGSKIKQLDSDAGAEGTPATAAKKPESAGG
jgi:membrane fusion protein (multidrug efflux system)